MRSEAFGQDSTPGKRLAKFCGIMWTTAYIVLFPILLYFSFFSLMVFDNPHMTAFWGFFIVFLVVLIPLSMPISIYLSWKLYNKARYGKAYLAWLSPFVVFIFA